MDTLFSCVCLGLLLLCTGVCAQIPTGKTEPGMVKDDVLMWNASYCVDWEVNLFISVCVTECIGSSTEAVSVTFLTGTFRCSTGKVRRRVRTALTVRSRMDLGVQWQHGAFWCRFKTQHLWLFPGFRLVTWFSLGSCLNTRVCELGCVYLSKDSTVLPHPALSENVIFFNIYIS